MAVTVKRTGDGLMSIQQKLGETHSLQCGVLEGAYNDVSGQRVAVYAACNEFGTNRIPSRPFMRDTLKRRGGGWIKTLTGALTHGYDVESALKMTGEAMVADIQETIDSNMPPPNAEYTVQQKTRSVDGTSETMAPGTLKDTGTLLKSIAYRVK